MDIFFYCFLSTESLLIATVQRPKVKLKYRVLLHRAYKKVVTDAFTADAAHNINFKMGNDALKSGVFTPLTINLDYWVSSLSVPSITAKSR